ncbi:rho guanine nucleotide exchange factor 15-like [Mantella aurantiaca]
MTSPALPPKLFQDPDERSAKMASCPPRPACPSRCCCGCHQQRPGFVLVWVPESSAPRGPNANDPSDPPDNGADFRRIPSLNDNEDDGGGKWGPRLLKDKMAGGASYPVRRRSLRYGERSRQNSADGVGDERVDTGVVLTSYKPVVDENCNSDSPHPACQEAVGEIPGVPEVPKHGAATFWKMKAGDHVDSSAAHAEDPPPSNLCNGPPPEHTNGYAPIAKASKPKSISFSDQAAPLAEREMNSGDSTESLTSSSATDASEVSKTEAAESRVKIRKPARRSKAPPVQSLCEPPAGIPPKVPSKPPRGAAPPPPPAPPPFLRKGSLKRYSTGNSEELSERDKKASTASLPLERGRDRHSSSDDANESSGSESSVFRSVPTVRSPRCIDWESHLRDEPLYQTYRQSVINKEIRRQTVSRNSSFTSYDSSQESPLSYGGSPKQGRRSTVSHNTLWQELPSVIESGVLETMSNEQKKMQESMFEVLTSEASYLRSMNVLTEHFLGCRDLQETLIIREKKILFSNVLKVKEVSERFLMDLESRVDEEIVISDVCDIIYHHSVHNFPVYKDYVRNQLYQEKTYSQLMEKNPQFHAVVCRLQELPQCQRLPFMSFLLLPFQRITRIKMLIENILKRTEEGSEAEQNASKALDAVSKIIQECNREVGRMRQTEELIHISSKIEFDKIKAIPIISQSRYVEKQGDLNEVHQKGSLFGIKPTKLSPVYFFLFNDFLLITQRKSADRHVVVDYAHRSLVQLQSCPTMENSFFLTLLENHQGKTCDRLFKAPTQSDLHRWTAAFPSKSDEALSGSDTIYEDWDCPQVHCVEQYTAMQADELSLEPSDIINVLRKTSEGWCEGIRLCDGKKGWFPARYIQEITNEHVRRRNLRERYRVMQAARQIVSQTDTKKKSSSA